MLFAIRPRLALVVGATGLLGSAMLIPAGAQDPPANPPADAKAADAKAARAQDAPPAPNLPAWSAPRSDPRPFVTPGGMSAQVISSTARWIVVQNEVGQQFPIAIDRIRQFLVRWPSSVAELSPTSMVEATGMTGPGGTLAVDHIDVYEPDAQSLVSPTYQGINLGGGGNGAMTFDDFTQSSFGIINYQEVSSFMPTPNALHVVGQSAGVNPIRLGGFGPNIVTVVPGGGGMSVTRVTMGNTSYAKKGDEVYVVPENVSARSLDVSQLILYKKIPIRQFQP